MWQIDGVKVSALTWGDLTVAVDMNLEAATPTVM